MRKRVDKITTSKALDVEGGAKIFEVRYFPRIDNDYPDAYAPNKHAGKGATIFDSKIGPVYGQDRIKLTLKQPSQSFGDIPLIFNEGIYVYIPLDGEVFITWEQ